jgi:hypothetical protein
MGLGAYLEAIPMHTYILAACYHRKGRLYMDLYHVQDCGTELVLLNSIIIF